jgi:D-alanyl-D-alanine carboxypeptidase
MKRAFPFLLLLVAAAAQADPVDGLVRDEMEKNGVVAISVGVLRDGVPVKMKGYGLASLELPSAVTPESVFKLASISKQFVAAGAMLLVQDGKLSLDDTLAQHFPDGPEVWGRITLRHLLTHTSGLQRELPDWSPLRTYSDEEILEMAKRARCGFEPGEKYEYCNTGYFLTGLLIAKVSGKPWPEFLEARIFRPLGMTSTRTTTLRDIVPNRVLGYERGREGPRNPTPLLGVRTSGALISNLNDLARWENELLRPTLFRPETLELMWTQGTLNGGERHGYGLGFQVGGTPGRRVVEHSGSLGGFRTHYLRLPDQRLAVIVLANTSTAEASALARRIARSYESGAR